MARDLGRAADILAYWRAIELFEPHGIPVLPKPGAALRRKPGTEWVERIRFGAQVPVPPLPWQAGHPRAGEEPAVEALPGSEPDGEALPNRQPDGEALPDRQPDGGTCGGEWRHTVYGGVFSSADVRKSFEQALGYAEQPDCGAMRKDVVSAMFAFVVDKDGRLIEGTEAFSPCAWAVGRLHRPGPGDPRWLEGFDEDMRECEKALRRAARMRREPGQGEPGQGESGQEGEGCVVRAPDVLALAWRLTRRLGLPPGIADPTEMRVVSTPICRKTDGSLPKADPPLLGSPIAPDIQRVLDAVRASRGVGSALASYLSEPPDREQSDREQSDREQSHREQSHRGQRGREKRSALTRDRVTLLDGVRPALFPPARWPDASDRPLSVSQQFAVNAIFRETGDIGDAGGLFSADQTSGAGEAVLLRDLIAAIIVRRAQVLATLPDPMDGFAEKHTWATSDGNRESVWQPRADLTGSEIVVASSNAAAIENITTELLALKATGDERQDQAWGMVAAQLGCADKRRQFLQRFWHGADGMQRLLRGYERDKPASAQWREAVERFAGAWGRSVEMAAAREAAAEALRSPAGAAVAAKRPEDTERAVRHVLDQHDLTRPRGLRAALDAMQGGPKRKAWQARTEVLARQHETLRQAVAEWGGAVPVDWPELPVAERERPAPWSDEEWLRARAEVFLAAVSLHRSFVAATAERFLGNVRHVLALLSRDPSAPPAGEAATTAWQTLFLLVPVVSTTFARYGQVFETLGREALGWLLVEEADQATPQAAAGALWRSRRAVFVGDPRRLTPVSQVPGEVQAKLRETYGVGVAWQPSAVSAQAVADRGQESRGWAGRVQPGSGRVAERVLDAGSVV